MDEYTTQQSYLLMSAFHVKPPLPLRILGLSLALVLIMADKSAVSAINRLLLFVDDYRTMRAFRL